MTTNTETDHKPNVLFIGTLESRMLYSKYSEIKGFNYLSAQSSNQTIEMLSEKDIAVLVLGMKLGHNDNWGEDILKEIPENNPTYKILFAVSNPEKCKELAS